MFTTLPFGTAVRAQDIVASDEVAGGSSVFVFRESRKKPQERSSGAKAFMSRGPAGAAGRKRVNEYVAKNWRTKRVPTLRKNTGPAAATAAAKRKIALSNTLTASADKMLDSKQTDQAIANYREALKQNPKNADATTGLSDALTAKGIETAGSNNDIAAATYLDEAVKLNPKNAAAYAKLGEIYDANNQDPKAIENYETALKIDSGLTDIYVPLGIVYFRTGEIAKAEAYAAKAETGPETAEGRYLRGLVQFRQNKNDQAVASFDRAIVLDSDLVTAYYYRGQALDRLEKDDQALASYKAAVAKDPAFAPAWHDMGVVYYNTGQYQNAVGAYQEAIKNDATDGQAHANLASSYRQLDQYPEANKEYWTAADVSPALKNDPDLHSEWGYCLGKTNEWDKAVAQTLVAQELSPTAIDYTNTGWAYYNAAEANKRSNQDAQAAADYELGKAFLQKAVVANPKLDAAYLNLGSTYNALGDYNSAVSTLNQAVTLHADWIIALNALGYGYRGMNNLSAAAATFNRVLTLDGNNISGLFYLGEVQYSLGNKKEARRLQQKLSSLNPNLANRLGRIVDGKEVLNDAAQKVKSKIPISIPKIPY